MEHQNTKCSRKVGDSSPLPNHRKARIDSVYGKKKHYNARDRYSTYHLRLGIAVVSFTALMGTSVFVSISESQLLSARVVAGIITVAIAVLAVLQTFFNYEKRALSHKLTADRYLALMKEAQRYLSYYKDGRKTLNDIEEKIEGLSNRIFEIQKDEPATSSRDYKKAQKGIDSGEQP